MERKLDVPNRYRDVGLIALTLVILVLANIPGQIALGQARQGSSSEARVGLCFIEKL